MMTTGSKSTFSKKNQGEGQKQTPKPERTRTRNTSNTDLNTCKNCGGDGHWMKECWRPSGGAYDNSNNDSNNNK